MEDYITDLEKVELTGASHFAQEDSAPQLSRHIVDWLQRKIPTDIRSG